MSLKYENSIAFLRDGYVASKDANLNIASSPILYGLSVYTVFNVRYDEDSDKLYIFRLDDHYKRLVESSKILDFGGFEKDWPKSKFCQTMVELILKNNVRENALVRASVFVDEIIAGTKIRGLKNSVSAYVYPMGQILPKNGANVCVSSWVRNADNSIPSRAKANGSYINASLMKNEALLNGYDEAIALDQSGHVTEGTIANIFLIKDGVLITPDSTSDILEGITRDTVFRLAESLGINHMTRPVDRSELYTADEIFFSGSSADITPVVSVDKRKVGDGSVGKYTEKLSNIYDRLRIGKIAEFADWLTEVKL